ncbi:MAG: hypothetical protein Q9M97_02350 [Candidatus Gracilibacteria bacterium]|nr:hypothetical protein [Candidatus Gracilibacteria bacterium]
MLHKKNALKMNKNKIKLIDKYFYHKDNTGEKFLGYNGFKRLKFNNYQLITILNSFLEIENRKKQNTFGLFGITTKINKTFGKRIN